MSELAGVIGPAPDWYLTLREEIVAEVERHPLINAFMRGEPFALNAALLGYWPFISGFGVEIVRRSPARNESVRFAIGEWVELIEAHQTKIRAIDGSHADLWRQLGKSVGVIIPAVPALPTAAMERLLSMLRGLDLPSFYAAEATVEVIAWALSDLAFRSPFFGADLPRWFEVHLTAPRPTHEEMYRWIAWRLLKTSMERDPVSRFTTDARGTLRLFMDVADHLWRERTAPT